MKSFIHIGTIILYKTCHTLKLLILQRDGIKYNGVKLHNVFEPETLIHTNNNVNWTLPPSSYHKVSIIYFQSQGWKPTKIT